MRTILIIEDTIDVLRNLTEILQMEGYQVITAGNGKEALGILERDLPDLIITDLRMPVMDGFTFISNLRTDAPGTSIPVVVFSANATAENQELCRSLGIGFIGKPASMEVILDAVAKALNI